MPNWCENTLQVSGREEDVHRWVERAASVCHPEPQPLWFEAFVPPPWYLHDSDLISWRCACWGTKWDAVFEEIGRWSLVRSKGDARYRFDTAWSPPLAWLQRMAADYPELRFFLTYKEEDEDMAGEMLIENSQVVIRT